MWIGPPPIQHSIIILPFTINVELAVLVAFRSSFIYSCQFVMNKIQNFNAWISNYSELQCLEKAAPRIPMFGKAKVQNSNLWKSQNPEFQCSEKPKFRISMFGHAKI